MELLFTLFALPLQEELAIFHTPEHIRRYCPSGASMETDDANDAAATATAPKDDAGPLATLHCGGVGVDSDTVWNPSTTSKSARLAVGQVMCLAHK